MYKRVVSNAIALSIELLMGWPDPGAVWWVGLRSRPSLERYYPYPITRLITTDVGGREGARKRELAWEQKNNQAGEELLG